ncbi:MAG TPA: hypothetical protein VEG32_07060 [Clostridia bacterium]|nr:hypothetical protein [Clostridia bacterium]
MKKSLVTLLLVFATAAVAQQAPAGDPNVAPQQQPPAAGQQAPAPAPAPGDPAAAQGQQGAQPESQKKVIKDPAEYNAYVAAIQTQDPNARAQALDAFLQSYPQSVMKEDALEAMMKAYQQTNNVAKITEAGQRLLQANPNNLTGLALLSYLNRLQAQSGGPNAAQLLQSAAEYGQRGIQQMQTAGKPEGYTDEQWAKMKDGFRVIFLGAIGQNALQNKDYATAQQALREAVNMQPDNFFDVFQLSLAYLEPKPIVVDGLFWVARAVSLAQQQAPQAVANIQNYARGKYVRYHGTDQGFTELLAAAAQTKTIPAGFTVAPAPSPADQAAEMMRKGTPPAQMSFGEWEFILSSGNQEAAQTVWTAIQGKLIKMQGWVMSGSGKTIQIAGTEDARNENRPDITLQLATALPAARTPKPGQLITFQGVIDSYTPEPFVLTMTDGAVSGGTAAAGKTPAKKAPARKR